MTEISQMTSDDVVACLKDLGYPAWRVTNQQWSTVLIDLPSTVSITPMADFWCLRTDFFNTSNVASPKIIITDLFELQDWFINEYSRYELNSNM